jgi:hypothetical protein
MKFWRISLVFITAGALAASAPAGFLFGNKKTKPNPAERVPELIVLVKTDKDESKRASAAEELRQYDPATYHDIVPVLIDVLLTDDKPAVRVEAAESLGTLRPVSQEAGWALEQARDKDTSIRVRTKARYVLLTYHWAGYHSDPKMKDAAVVANPKDQGKTVTPVPGSSPAVTSKGVPPQSPTITPTTVRPTTGQSAPPPLADPTTKPAPVPSQAPRPLPQGPPPPVVPPAKINPAPLPPAAVPTAPAKVEPAPLPAIPLPPE